MKQKEIIKHLKEGKTIVREKIGYQTDYIYIIGQRLTERQLFSLIDKDIIEKTNTQSKTVNGIGGKLMDVITITYKLKVPS